VPLFGVVADCVTIRGSFVGNREDMAETLAIADEGKVRADVELAPLASINSVFERLERGAVAGRVVIDYAKVPTIRSDTDAAQRGNASSVKPVARK
jgi:propanol-preferring alcohol dehydrogenase